MATWDNTKKKECGTFFAEQVGLVNVRDNKCISLNVYERDCDGMAVDKKSLSTEKFIGLLQLGKNEKWLIFASSGHESNGLTALPFEAGKPIDLSKSEELHSTGC